MGTHPPSLKRRESVCQDWRTPLDGAKSDVYQRLLFHLTTEYNMFSVALDEALEMRRAWQMGKALQALALAPVLCGRLSGPMIAVLRGMMEHARHFSTTPNVAALDPENFQNTRSQRIARFNGAFSRILLSRRSQFIHKIAALAELSEELTGNLVDAVEEIAGESSAEPERCWESLDGCHYDLNTCLRETEVLLKSFLHALPGSQLAQFQETLQGNLLWTAQTTQPMVRHLAHRRLASVKGQ